VSAAEETVRRGFGAKSRPFVFPAKNKSSRSGHYTESVDLLHRLRDEVGLQRLNRHDLRRSFGALMAAKPLPWNSKELAGLGAYLQIQQKSFKPSR